MLIRLSAALVTLVPLLACGSDGARVEPPRLSELEAEIFHTSCAFSTCHSGSSPAASMDLSGDVYDELVDVPSADAEGRVRVLPGDARRSYLLEKLTSSEPAAGDPMPPPSGGLEPERIARIRAWIEAGARDD